MDKVDTLIIAFPLPYRVLSLVGVGLLGWATNLHGLHKLEIDVVAAMDLRTEGYPPRLPLSNLRRPSFVGGQGIHSGHVRSMTYLATPQIYYTMYRVVLGYSALCFVSWLMYRVASRGNAQWADTYGWIPACTAGIMVLLLVVPHSRFFQAERHKFTQAIRRCFFSSSNTPILFSDVILADICTSFAKVIGDVWLSICMILPGNSMLNPPPQVGLARWILPTVMSLPYLARFRQCIIEYNLPSNMSTRPLFNAIKYATAFPVIYLSAAQGLLIDGSADASPDDPWHGEYRLFRLWLLSVFVNSLYSFWWDVSNDWGLELLKPSQPATAGRRPPKPLISPRLHSSTPLIARDSSPSSSQEDLTGTFPSPTHPPRRGYPWGLRPSMLYPAAIYPLLVVVNFGLRMSWTVKLATHLHVTKDGSIAVFYLEVAEIVRRWLWVFIRVEWEVIKKLEEGEPISDPSPFDHSRSSSSDTLSGSVSSDLLK
ncbi:EXS family-domain-containing protein [Coprinopsis sp. MPI-PUGE-AT-0042]|nr:EXS family-domain-containing protein [Coprinopsis sp. MPI-PUGE-AT-0042]